MDVRIRYWFKDTMEVGHWRVSGLIPVDVAKKIVSKNIYDRAEIVLDEDGWPLLEANQRKIKGENNEL